MKSSKQCLAASPGTGWRCELRRGHIKYPTDWHRAAFAKWSNDEGSIWSGPQSSPPIPLEEFNSRLGLSRETSMAAADPEQQLIDWWMGKAASEVELTVPKAIEYGSTDLIDIGVMLGRTMRRPVDEEEAAELGVFFYLIGKIARWQSAIERGERVSDDTLLDIGVYVRMAQRIRHSGGWPGVKNG